MSLRRKLPLCLVCQEASRWGLQDGYFIKGQFICARCEQMITRLNVHDPCYPLVRERMKRIWRQEFSDGNDA
jgi:hypothetical protein